MSQEVQYPENPRELEIVTPPGRLSYPHIVEPHAFAGKNPKFSADLDEAAERAVLDNTRRLRNLGYEIGVEQGVFPPPDVKVPPSVLKGVSQEIDLFYLDQRARHMRNN